MSDEDEDLTEHINWAAVEEIARKGIADIERGDFTLVSGPDGQQALLNKFRALIRARARGQADGR